MELIKQVRRVCRRLARCGWRDFLLQVTGNGLDIEARDLRAELSKPLKIDPDRPGFTDFAPDGDRGITPGDPARSLLYHALASPHVAHESLTCYPTQREIEIVENYVYGADPVTLADLKARAGDAPLGIVVFAREYRPASGTPHHRYADLCYSRAGIARAGTAPPQYSARERGYLSFVEGRDFDIPVQPARYAAYIAAQRAGNESFLGDYLLDPEDRSRRFWTPLHKLFSGSECLTDVPDLKLRFETYHINEKLRRMHQVMQERHFQTGWNEPDLSKRPFRFTTRIADLDRSASSCLVVPKAHERLVEPATYRGRPLAFHVPQDYGVFVSSSMEIESDGISSNHEELRSAPELVHVRDRVRPEPADLNQLADVERCVAAGGYEARHYLDFTGDGWVRVSCPALSAVLPCLLPAYSVVAAPDFMPAAIQREIQDWSSQALPEPLRAGVWAMPPSPLADQRFPPNLQLKDDAFQSDDVTATAIVTADIRADHGLRRPPRPPRRPLARPYLPDSSAGLFAPGWDVCLARTGEVQHLVTYGLGSPFLEDAKLCAAFSAFWPAAGPDTTRAYPPTPDAPTITPLTDEENGQKGGLPWDGVVGPQADYARRLVRYHSMANIDYVRLALDNRFTTRLTQRIDSDEYTARTMAMLRVYRALGVQVEIPIDGSDPEALKDALGQAKARWAVLSFRRPAADDRTQLHEAEEQAGVPLGDDLYRFEVYTYGEPYPDPDDPLMRLVPIRSLVTLYVDAGRILMRADDGPWEAKGC